MLCGDLTATRSEADPRPGAVQLVEASRALDDYDEDGGLVIISQKQQFAQPSQALGELSSRSTSRMLQNCHVEDSFLASCNSPYSHPDQTDDQKRCEEECRWEQRRLQTGAAARIVTYDQGVSPQNDITFRDGANGRIVVGGVRRFGRAWEAGVCVDDVLVSIGGKKDFCGMSAMEVYGSLTGPVTLVFMGFVGQLMAEVRLPPKSVECGLSWREAAEWENGELIDEVVFQPYPSIHGVVPRTAHEDTFASGEPLVTPGLFIRL